MKTATVRARIEPKLKHSVEAVLAQLGLSVSVAIELFLRQVNLNHGIPFEIKLPNKATLKTFSDTDRNKNLKRYKSAKDMFDEVGQK